MSERLLRAIYGIEFLIALVAGLQFWSYVGGQTHLDYIPWFWKFALSLGVAAAAVKITIAPTLRQAWKWILLLALLLTAGGLLSYYAHLNEPQDEDDTQDQDLPTSLKIHFELPRPVRQLHQQRPIVL
jgi:hypothetical protein